MLHDDLREKARDGSDGEIEMETAQLVRFHGFFNQPYVRLNGSDMQGVGGGQLC